MTTASIPRGRIAGRHTLTITAAVAIILLMVQLVSTNRQQSEHRQTTVALAELPALTVADPDPLRTPYVRDDWLPHGWIDHDGDGCNTRREVLIAESTTKPSVNPVGCRISGGRWNDRFSTFETANEQELQIDHLVALADAHRSGGWNWPSDRKLAFANNLDDPDELNALSSTANQDKGDKGPDAWMPKSAAARCDYIHAYVNVKAKWQLSVTPAQWKAIARVWPSCPKATSAPDAS